MNLKSSPLHLGPKFMFMPLHASLHNSVLETYNSVYSLDRHSCG